MTITNPAAALAIVLLLSSGVVIATLACVAHRPPRMLLVFTGLVALSFLFLGCGGNASTATLSPEQVAREYVTAAYLCGEQGAGRAYDLSTSSARTWPRSKFISEEARHGCRPQPVPSLNVIRGDRTPDVAVVAVEVVPSPGSLEGRGSLLLTLRRSGDGTPWLVDTQDSTDPEWLTAT